MNTAAQQEVRRLLDQMIAVSGNNPRVERLTDELHLLVMAHALPTVDCPWIDRYGLTPGEAKMVRYLFDCLGSIRSREQIINAMYFDQPDDQPQDKLLDVLACRIRKKLKGAPYSVEAVWSRGFRMIDTTKKTKFS